MKEFTIPDAAHTDDRAERIAQHFLFREAELLDSQQFPLWLESIGQDIVYRVPVRTTRDNRDNRESHGFSTSAFFMDEDYASLKTRVLRVGSDFAWAENPSTRTRRIVANVRVRSSCATRIECASNLAIYCYRGDASLPLVLTGEREDVLILSDGAWKLDKRVVYFDATVLGLESLSIFL